MNKRINTINTVTCSVSALGMMRISCCACMPMCRAIPIPKSA